MLQRHLTMRILLFFILLISFLRFQAQSMLYKETILMDYTSTSLTAVNIQQIRSIWERLPFNSSVELKLVSDKEIKKLSPLAVVNLTKARAAAIKSLLTTQKIVNINDIELNTNSFVEVEKIHNTDASFDRVVRNPYKVYSLVLSKEVPLCYDYTDAERRALNSKTPSVFTIPTSQDQRLEGPGGVIVLIPANSFLLPDGKKAAEVKIKLWEFLTTEEMLAANLYTTSKGRLLETGGMIYISAESEGTCVKLLRSSKITIKFPTPEKLDSMRLFKGIPFPAIIDWEKTNNMDKVNPPVTEATLSPDAEGSPGSMFSDRDSGFVDYYALESSGLGWINCDRFYNVSEKMDIAFTYPSNFMGASGVFRGTAGLIFTDIRSIMPGDLIPTKKNNVIFNNIPKGQRVVLLVYTLTPDKKKVLYSTRKVTVGDLQSDDELKFTETSFAEFKQMLQTIKY
jgi:hypothetical protein